MFTQAQRSLRWHSRRAGFWRCRLGVALLVALLGAARAQAVCILSIETWAGDSAIELRYGETVSLRTTLTTDDPTGVVGLFYTVQMASDGWQLRARDYASYGWVHNDGLFDGSTPVPATTAFPVTITNDLYDLTPGTPDFLFNTSLVEPTNAITDGVVESFELAFPMALPIGDYLISFDESLVQAFDLNGVELPVEFNAFTVTVVPEPAVGVLAALALVSLAARRPRRPA